MYETWIQADKTANNNGDPTVNTSNWFALGNFISAGSPPLMSVPSALAINISSKTICFTVHIPQYGIVGDTYLKTYKWCVYMSCSFIVFMVPWLLNKRPAKSVSGSLERGFCITRKYVATRLRTYLYILDRCLLIIIIKQT